MAIWSGAKLNPHRQVPAKKIGFIDGPAVDKEDVPLDQAAHQKLWEATMTNVRELLGDSEEDDRRLEDVAFCLGAPYAETLFTNR